MNVSVSRILLFVEADADRVAAALAAVAESRIRAVPTTRRDGSETLSYRVLVGGCRFEVVDGRASAPPVVEVAVDDPVAAGERLTAAGFTAPVATDKGQVCTSVGGISIRIRRAES